MTPASTYVSTITLGPDIVLARGLAGPVIHDATAILGAIEQRCGAEVAMLFAQPAVKATPDATVVAWYAVSEGAPRSLGDLDEVGRRPFAQVLAARLARLRPLLSDQEFGPTLGACLNLLSPGDIYVVGNDPVLVNWGLLPRAVAASEVAREAHFRSTLGAFEPLPTPPLDARDAHAFTSTLERRAAAVRQTEATRQAAEMQQAAAAPVAAPVSLPQPQREPARRAWLAPLLASLAAGGVLAALAAPGVLGYPASTAGDQAAVDRERQLLEEVNRSLQTQIEALRPQADRFTCRARPEQQDAAQGVAPALLPPPAAQTPVTPATPGGPTNAAQLADEAVVLVRAQFPDGSATGSAFFIDGQHLVTNDHVVSMNGQVATSLTIENKVLGRRVPVRVKARSAHEQHEYALDLAVLEAPANNTGRAFLKLAPDPAKTSGVRAVGYPGLVLEQDTATIPESSMSDGNVSTFFTPEGGAQLIVHTAAIFPGNSGGPLVDLCSRAVGVNTALISAARPGRAPIPGGVFLAQPGSVLKRFLVEKGVAITEDASACAPPPVAFLAPPAGGTTPPASGTPQAPGAPAPRGGTPAPSAGGR